MGTVLSFASGESIHAPVEILRGLVDYAETQRHLWDRLYAVRMAWTATISPHGGTLDNMPVVVRLRNRLFDDISADIPADYRQETRYTADQALAAALSHKQIKIPA